MRPLNWEWYYGISDILTLRLSTEKDISHSKRATLASSKLKSKLTPNFI